MKWLDILIKVLKYIYQLSYSIENRSYFGQVKLFYFSKLFHFKIYEPHLRLSALITHLIHFLIYYSFFVCI